jgi:light-regulated signal transduction histidine kinase (bacteriophytochrome)
LRNINAFAELLKDHGEGKFDVEERDMLNQVIQSTYRMEELIQDLLSLSRVSRARLHPKTVDLSFLVRHILSQLQAAEPQRTVELLIAPNIKAQGDEGLLRIALENLLNNAWKFTRRCAGGRIEFGAEQYNGQLVYFVRDNGAGFDMADADKLFGTFQRLHSDEDFPGTGIGLATVQRIIHRHGGRIWADGKPNQGATFYFTLSNAR